MYALSGPIMDGWRYEAVLPPSMPPEERALYPIVEVMEGCCW
jgi:hypothetical protein